jgi:hypothetical protein
MTLAVLVAAIARPATRAARVAWTSCLVAGMLACGASTVARGAGPLEAAHWIARCAEPDRVVADANAVAAFNRRLLAEDPALTDLAKLPATIPQAEVEERVRRRSAVPDRPLVFGDGTPADEAARLLALMALSSSLTAFLASAAVMSGIEESFFLRSST